MNPLWERLVMVVAWLVAGIILIAVGLWMFGHWHDEWSGYNSAYGAGAYGSCNVVVIPIEGEVVPYAGAQKDGMSTEENLPPSTNPADVLASIKFAEHDPAAKAILLRVNSYGGSAAASEVIAEALQRTSIPVVAVVNDVAASAGYLIAAAADHVIASPFSDVGSIGVTMSYLETVEKNAKEGQKYIELTSAPYKDYGVPDRPLAAAERALIERDLKIYHDHFVALVARYRNMPVEAVQKLADGSSMPGSLGLENGLIDALGGYTDAERWIEQETGLPAADIVVCE